MKTPSPVEPVRPSDPEQSAQLSRWMGLVLALRFCCWGAAVGTVALFLFLESARYRGLLQWVTVPALLALYLLGTGQFLLLLRWQSWGIRTMAVGGPLLTLGLVSRPGIASSVSLVGLALVLGLWLHLGAFSAQAHALGHGRSWRWYSRLRLALLLLAALLGLLPGQAAQLISLAGLLLLGAVVAGWRLWLGELRLSIAARENV
jgi:hypothetical protein